MINRKMLGVPGLVVVSILLSCGVLSPDDRLVSEVLIAEDQLKLGDVLEVTMITTNQGTSAVHSAGCGPGLGFVVTLPDGSRRHPVSEVAHICPLFDSNILEPGETDSVTWGWQPPVTGSYSVRSGVRRVGGLDALSPAKGFQVR